MSVTGLAVHADRLKIGGGGQVPGKQEVLNQAAAGGVSLRPP